MVDKIPKSPKKFIKKFNILIIKMQENSVSEDFFQKFQDEFKVKNNSPYYQFVQAYHKQKEEAEELRRLKQKTRKNILKKLLPKRKSPEYIDYENRMKKIRSILKKGKKLMQKNVYAATAMYSTLQPIYEELPNPFKAKAFSEIKPFYIELKRRIDEIQQQKNDLKKMD